MAFLTDTDEKTLTIEKWLGLNESPDGDVNLKAGEASVMKNWRVTADGNLKVRPGYETLAALASGHPVRALWSGYVNEVLRLVAVCNGHVYGMASDWSATDLGTLTDGATAVFGFADKVYFLNGHEYKYWDGTTFGEVSGYAPVITTATEPSGSGTDYEPVNLLTGSKIQWFSPTSTSSTTFYLAEQDIDSVDEVYDNGTLRTAGTDYTVNLANGAVTLTPSVSGAPNTVTIQYTKANTENRALIEAMKYAEVYGGVNDCRVFLYGDGTNRAYYSGVDFNGAFHADYFPAAYEMNVGSENTPITGMSKQYDRLLVLKTDSAWYAESYGTITGDDGDIITAFTILPLNDAIGNEAPGQVRLIENNPVSLCRNAAYEWMSTQIRDERMAKRISDRTHKTLEAFDLSGALAFENDRDREHWVVCGSDAVVHNYQSDTWYAYDNLPVTALVYHSGRILLGLSDGRICDYHEEHRSDNGAAISALWRGGAFSFGADYLKKYINRVFITMRPETFSLVKFSVLTNNKTSAPQEKEIFYHLATFSRADFADWSFKTSRRPQTKKIKMKLKNFSFFTPMLESDSDYQTATVLNMSIPVQFGGEVKTR